MAQKKKPMSFRFDERMFSQIEGFITALGLSTSYCTKTEMIEIVVDVMDDLIYSGDDAEVSWYRYKFNQRGFREKIGTRPIVKKRDCWSVAELEEVLDAAQQD